MIIDFEKYLQSLTDPSKMSGMNTNSNVTVSGARKRGVQAQRQQQQQKKEKEEKIKSRMEMKPTLVKRASFAEKLRGGKDTYKQTPQVIGMSGADPVGEFVVAGATLNPIFKLAGNGILYTLARTKGNPYQNWARAKLLNRELRNPQIPNSGNSISIKGVSIKEDRPKFWDGERFYTPEEEFNRRLRHIPDDIIDEKSVTVDPLSNLGVASNTAGFTPMVKANIGKFNKMYADETINRLKGWGYNVDDVIPMEVQGWRVLDRPSTYIKNNAEKPVYLGVYKNKDTVSGSFDPQSNVAFADPTLSKNLPSTIFHERNIHGTDNVLEALAETQGSHGVDKYQAFIDKLFMDEVQDPLVPGLIQRVVQPGVRIEMKPDGRSQYFVNFGKNVGELPISDGTLRWYEGRSTINELKRKYLYNVWKNAEKPKTLEEVRPQYLEAIDNLPEETLLKDLSDMNGYGQTYVALRKNNPSFIPDLKDLLKYGAGIAVPVTMSNKLDFLKNIKNENNL